MNGDTAIVESARLEWDGQSLALGTPQDERVTIARDGDQLASRCAPGDVVALHWDWLCERLDPRQAHWLQRCTAEQLRVVNALPSSTPAAVPT